MVSSAMFDWNDEEITNIIWDEAVESADNIVPFQEAGEDYSKKEWSQEAGTIKFTEQKLAGVNVKGHERRLETSSNFDSIEGTSASGFGIDSLCNLSVLNTYKTDQDSLDTSVSNNLTEITKFDSSGGEIAQLDKDLEIFQNNDGGKEQGDFIDYGWANIGSFDDLDRIFSNDDPLFGNVSLGSADEIWNSSKDISNSSVKSFALSVDSPTLGLGAPTNTSENFESETEYVQEDEQPLSAGCGRLADPLSHGLQTTHPVLDHADYAGSKINDLAKEQAELSIIGKNSTSANSQLLAANVAVPNELADKSYIQKKPLKNRKKHEEKNELKLDQDVYGNWSASGNLSGQFKNQFSPSIMQSPTSSVLTQQRPLEGPESLHYQQICNQYVTPSGHRSITNPCSGMPVMSHIQSEELNRQSLLSGYDVSSCKANPVNKSTDSMVKAPTMTTQEKIEKLRKRQQLRTMLPIQKEQQELCHKVSSSDQSMVQKFSQENRIQNVGVSDLDDDVGTFPSFDLNSLIEEDVLNRVSFAVDDCSLEDKVLFQLQEIISKLDARIKICIRDSVFRLAQSATQRHYGSDTGSTNNSSRDEQVDTKEEAINHGRNTKMPEVETGTNPIDRTVAHLLFHRPSELSGKHPDTPESPVSTKLPLDHKLTGTTKLPVGSLPDRMQAKQNFSQQASKNSCPLVDLQPVNQSKSSIYLDGSENASIIESV